MRLNLFPKQPSPTPPSQNPSPLPTPRNDELVLALVDELVRMETNLRHIDPAIKGYKQLLRSVERMKTHLLAHGYEVVDMVGQPYVEGMLVVANFVLDESLPEGTQVITSVTKPQVNYQGQMIQVAQITVSQNL